MSTKLIRIPHRGVILGRPGGIIGPILTPYREELDVVRRMVQLGTSVVEVLPDGKEKKLTVANLLEEVAVAHEVPAKPAKAEAKAAPVVEKKEAPKQEQPKAQQNKNNRNNRNNNQPVEDAVVDKK